MTDRIGSASLDGSGNVFLRAGDSVCYRKAPCQHDGQSRGQRAACAVRIVRLNSFAFIDMEIAAVIEDIHRIFHAVAALHEDCLAAQKGELLLPQRAYRQPNGSPSQRALPLPEYSE